jgi:RNA polymerase sigma-70 factor (ECF subfamily)
MSTENYWEKYVDGDNQALAGLYRPLFRKLFFVAFKFTHNESEALDIVQDLFTLLLQTNVEERKTKWKSIVNIDAFLCTLVKCKSMDYLKVENNRKKIRATQFGTDATANDSSQEFHEQLNYLIQQLPLKEQELITLHLSGYKNDEIATMHQQSEKSVRNRLSESRNKLRILWTKNYVWIVLLNWIN